MRITEIGVFPHYCCFSESAKYSPKTIKTRQAFEMTWNWKEEKTCLGSKFLFLSKRPNPKYFLHVVQVHWPVPVPSQYKRTQSHYWIAKRTQIKWKNGKTKRRIRTSFAKQKQNRRRTKSIRNSLLHNSYICSFFYIGFQRKITLSIKIITMSVVTQRNP